MCRRVLSVPRLRVHRPVSTRARCGQYVGPVQDAVGFGAGVGFTAPGRVGPSQTRGRRRVLCGDPDMPIRARREGFPARSARGRPPTRPSAANPTPAPNPTAEPRGARPFRTRVDRVALLLSLESDRAHAERNMKKRARGHHRRGRTSQRGRRSAAGRNARRPLRGRGDR